jgi:Protein of unknown function (DUF2380)
MYQLGPALALALGLVTGPPTVAVLPLTAADPGIPYEVLPSVSELRTMTHELRAGLTDNGIVLAPEDKPAKGPCFDEECAQRFGRALHVRQVVFGSVARLMAVWWSTELAVVDVRTGKVLGEMRIDYKGDVLSMERGERNVGACVARQLKREKPCSHLEKNTFPDS